MVRPKSAFSGTSLRQTRVKVMCTEGFLKNYRRRGKHWEGRFLMCWGSLSLRKILRELLIEAIRYGDRPEVRAMIDRVVDTTLERKKLEALLEEKSCP